MPQIGMFKKLDACVPVNNGTVNIHIDGNEISVLATIPNGELVIGSEKYELICNEEIKIIV